MKYIVICKGKDLKIQVKVTTLIQSTLIKNATSGEVTQSEFIQTL